jgi:uncharacterized protein (TIGR02118 family)
LQPARRFVIGASRAEYNSAARPTRSTDIWSITFDAMAIILVLYNPPADPAAFDSYYFGTHVPIARKIPGLRKMRFNATPPLAIVGSAPHLVAELEFDSMSDIQTALASPEGQATAADLSHFAHAGVTVLAFDTRPDQ